MGEKGRGPWFWIVGCGCGCVVLFVAIVMFFGGLGVFGVMGAFRNSEAFQRAVEMARADSRVVAALGEPIKAGWLPSGHIDASGGSGSADLTIPLSGPLGKAKLYVVAHKGAGQWTFDRVEVELSDGERVVLQEGPASDGVPFDAEGRSGEAIVHSAPPLELRWQLLPATPRAAAC